MATDPPRHEPAPHEPAPQEPPPPRRFEDLLLRLGTVGELLALLVRGGRWWLLPPVILLLLMGLGLVALSGVQYVAPFIYMVF